VEIAQYFQNKCYPIFGIGTNLTNDTGHPTLDIVIKMTYANQHPVIKISDSKGKTICEDPNFLQAVKEQFKL
ncbi:MAG TPA: nicotinate phosphoribosyltransferase, partial [Candidatus Berkiella sp.]|nr:nicotinate phosphoribosyltransferase [Candidatus Berkiella sp.]